MQNNVNNGKSHEKYWRLRQEPKPNGRMAGTHTDIHWRKEQEQELLLAKKMAEESDKLKTAFLQNMSHEIRTPLNAISGFTNMLAKKNLSEEKRDTFISIIQASTKQLISIVSDILTVAALETNQEKINLEEININSLLINLFTIFKQQIGDRNIDFFVKQGLKNEEVDVFSDYTKLNQILSNLISNALKFTHSGYIQFGYQYINHNSDNPMLEFYVRDSGIGIAGDFLERIFGRFMQADNSISKSYGGSGLGLSISKGFVELLGGKIWVKSEPDKGSSFYFTIPYKPVKNIITKTESNNKKYTVLVAEDEEYNYLILEEILFGFIPQIQILHARNGAEAIEICYNNKNVILVLMDIKMPVLDGYKAAIEIRKAFPALPLIAQSAYALKHEIEQYQHIFNDYITKPIMENELKSKIKKYLLNDK